MMKTVNRILQILAIVFGLGAIVLFFLPFAQITTNGNAVTATGAQLAFGGKLDGFDSALAKSADILFCFILTAFGFIFSVFSFKKKGLRYAASAFGIVPAIYMLVIALSSANKFVDTRPLPNVTAIEYKVFVLLTAIVLFAFTACAVAYLLVDDYLEVKESKTKKTIFKRIALFFRDYKSEIKKIVWPGPRDVVKNTVIVLIMCVLIGVLIWVLDFGIGRLLELILNKSA